MSKRLFGIPLWFVVVGLLAASGTAQQPNKAPASQATKMKQLDFLVGTWRGSGSIAYVPGQPRKFSETERVQPKLDGLALLIEGVGRSSVAPGRTRVVHHALAVVSYDVQRGGYRWNAYDVEGPRLFFVAARATLNKGVVRWGCAAGPGSQFRFAFHLDSRGRWVESGEMSRDGKTWRPFFSMTLSRAR